MEVDRHHPLSLSSPHFINNATYQNLWGWKFIIPLFIMKEGL